MSATMNNGGPAFPTRTTGHLRDDGAWENDVCPGMTLRDWFAGQVISGITASSAVSQPFIGDPPWVAEGLTYNQWAAKCAYAVADAMLAARNASTTK